MTRLFIATWIGAISILLSGLGLWVFPLPSPPRTDGGGPPMPSLEGSMSGVQPVRLVSNPFREDRGRAARRYRPLDLAVASEEPTAPDPEPVEGLVLEGLITGPLGGAIVRGVPTVHDAVLIRIGEAVHGLQIDAMRGDTVWLSGLGSTWRLSLRRPW